MKRLASIILACTMLLTVSVTAFAMTEEQQEIYTIDVAYEFPYETGTPEWSTLITIEDKIAACQIPEDILESMTTEALSQTVANYPLAVNLFVYDDLSVGYEKVKSQFNGLQELERRMLLENGRRYTSSDMQLDMENQEVADPFREVYVDTLVKCLDVVSHDASYEKVSTRASISSVETPNGSDVTAYKNLDWSDHGFTENEYEAIK